MGSESIRKRIIKQVVFPIAAGKVWTVPIFLDELRFYKLLNKKKIKLDDRGKRVMFRNSRLVSKSFAR